MMPARQQIDYLFPEQQPSTIIHRVLCLGPARHGKCSWHTACISVAAPRQNIPKAVLLSACLRRKSHGGALTS
eukprot:scaffold18827_cov117-Isochrysis_galbana.AAC.7